SAPEPALACVVRSGRYPLLDQSGLKELLPLCAERGIAVICGGVFNSGILADPGLGGHYNYMPAPPEVVARARRLQAVCERHGVPLPAAAIQFPLGHPAVAPVVGGPPPAAELAHDRGRFPLPIPAVLWADLRREGLVAAEAPTP